MDVQPKTPSGRPTHSRTFSLQSDQSNGSKGSKSKKGDLTESPQEKARRDSIWKNTSKANPNAAINEAQPGAAAMLEETTIQPLRNITHRDSQGNVIADPDLSNPTRPRLERPLDTIRSFERAIDNGYKRRASYNRSETNDQQASRRNSGYFNNGPGPNTGRGQHSNSYYGGQRPDSYVQSNGPRNQHGGNRGYSDGPTRGYGQHAHNQSHHTDMTNGSDSTGPWANSTDPSSENSSLDRPYNTHNNGSGYQGQGGIPEEQGAYGGPPIQQPQEARRPIALGNSNGSGPPPPAHMPSAAKQAPEKKRQSWLKRRFSKKE